jgi:hypothetical protein
MFERPSCVDCKTTPPETNTQTTLVSKLGWRVIRAKQADGSTVVEWRCATCWLKRKAKLGQIA